MKILVTGASGFIGRALVTSLRTKRVLVEAFPGRRLLEGPVHSGILDGVETVIHLAGDNLAEGRWTEEKKRRIRDSRIQSTRPLAEEAAQKKPKVFVCASAVGFYGDRGDEWLDEGSGPGEGFLAEVCRDWEAACLPASASGVRVVQLRFGVVLGKGGGALAKMLPPFKLGLGGPIGSGRQFMSWASLEDAVAAIQLAVENEKLSGPVNVVSPNPATSKEFASTLGRVLGRPAFLPLPAFAARLAFGEMADEALLASQRAKPSKLLAAGYSFKRPVLEDALRDAVAS